MYGTPGGAYMDSSLRLRITDSLSRAFVALNLVPYISIILTFYPHQSPFTFLLRIPVNFHYVVRPATARGVECTVLRSLYDTAPASSLGKPFKQVAPIALKLERAPYPTRLAPGAGRPSNCRTGARLRTLSIELTARAPCLYR